MDPRWAGSQLSWTDVHPITLKPRYRPLFATTPEDAVVNDDRDLWHYRRIIARRNLDQSFNGGEVTLINWPHIDYWELPLLGVSAETRARALVNARELTLSFVHWMQTEAPRSDGGTGYPELRLRGDVLGTNDGLAREPYVRESRRIKAAFTVTEGHIGKAMRGSHAGSEVFRDSVGIGYYGSICTRRRMAATTSTSHSFPFQIPMGALIAPSVSNFLPANKNIGTTHITNGAYRLHSVEWSIGEAAGALAAYCLTADRSPVEVHADSGEVRKFQEVLTGIIGVHLAWPDEIRRSTADDDA